jgi:hypothetical protein
VVAAVSFFSLCEHGFESMICADVVEDPTASEVGESAYRDSSACSVSFKYC